MQVWNKKNKRKILINDNLNLSSWDNTESDDESDDESSNKSDDESNDKKTREEVINQQKLFKLLKPLRWLVLG